MSKRRTPNDQRATIKNPTSSDYVADRANRIAQGHPNIPPPPPTQPASKAHDPAEVMPEIGEASGLLDRIIRWRRTWVQTDKPLRAR
jgi:hypothetical protein